MPERLSDRDRRFLERIKLLEELKLQEGARVSDEDRRLFLEQARKARRSSGMPIKGFTGNGPGERKVKMSTHFGSKPSRKSKSY